MKLHERNLENMLMKLSMLRFLSLETVDFRFSKVKLGKELLLIWLFCSNTARDKQAICCKVKIMKCSRNKKGAYKWIVT